MGKLEKEIKDKYSDSDVNTIWNLLKNEIHRSVTENIPQKMLKHRKNLPWITNELKTKMSKYKKKYKKYKLSGKCKEHVVTSSIMKHLEYNNILYDLQHGFRSSRSCET